MELNSFSTAALAQIFNVVSDKPVARFADKASAVRRTAAALATEGAARKLLAQSICPACGDRHNGMTYGHNEEHLLCHMCGTEFNANTGEKYVARKANGSASKAIAASWADPEVRADRLTRCACTVNGTAYASVGKAFAALGLPRGSHIRVRMEVKAAGRCEFRGYVFLKA